MRGGGWLIAEVGVLRQWIRDWFTPAPDSLVANSIRKGKSPWVDAVHLLWSIWVFVTPIFSGYSWRWALLTLLSYPVFIFIYASCCVAPRRYGWRYAAALLVMALALLPWYASALTYFIYGCIMLRGCNMGLRRYLVALLALNVVCLVEAWLLHYVWQAVVWIPFTTIVIALAVYAERVSDEKDAELRLSHDEVRRLAALAERERIGRDLHDLLGHTLSLITLKLELSRKLFDRDPEAARREMTEAERVARHALSEVRSAVSGIRATDLAAELASARLILESSGVSFECSALPPSLPVDVERCLALVLREAVTNIARHARATQAKASVSVAGQVLQLCIEDDGRGGVTSHGNGLSGMHERVRALGGVVLVESPAGRGTRVQITVPLRQRPTVQQPDAPAPTTVETDNTHWTSQERQVR